MRPVAAWHCPAASKVRMLYPIDILPGAQHAIFAGKLRRCCNVTLRWLSNPKHVKYSTWQSALICQIKPAGMSLYQYMCMQIHLFVYAHYACFDRDMLNHPPLHSDQVSTRKPVSDPHPTQARTSVRNACDIVIVVDGTP